eukprot:6575209-Lingulodinium_polyedra.AAC.1
MRQKRARTVCLCRRRCVTARAGTTTGAPWAGAREEPLNDKRYVSLGRWANLGSGVWIARWSDCFPPCAC